MNESAFVLLVGLAVSQVHYYRLKVSEVGKQLWFLWFFYFSVFLVAFAVRFVCARVGILFYQLPLLSVVLFLVAIRRPAWRPTFSKAFPQAPHFCALPAFWLGFGSFVIVPQLDVLTALVWAFVAAILLFIVVGMKERLDLTKGPSWFSGPPVLWFSVGILMLALFGLRAMGNW